MQNLSSHEAALVAAIVKFFIVDRLLFGGVGCAFDQKDRAACGDSKGLRNGHIGRHGSRQYSAPTSGPVVFLLEQGEDRLRFQMVLHDFLADLSWQIGFIEGQRSVVCQSHNVECGPPELPEESRAVAIRIRWRGRPA